MAPTDRADASPIRRTRSTSAARSRASAPAQGRLATIGIVIERSSDPALIGQGFLLYVEDRDAIDSAATDRITYAFVDPPQTRRCTARRPTPFQLVAQWIVVEDSADVDPPEEPGAKR